MSALEPFDGRVDGSRLLIPSFIDMHVHFRDFEQKGKETVGTGSMAALAGGASAVCDMPNTVPPVDDKETYERRRSLFSNDSLCDYLINFCVYDDASLEEARLVDPLFIKVFLEETTGSLILDERKLEELFKLRKPIALHTHLEGMREGIKLSKRYGTHLHICHVSTKEEVEVLARYKDENITCEVTPHHLFLSSDYDVKPPISSERDRRYLWGALGNIVDIVASDHAPHTSEDKERGAYGVSGVETTLPLMYTALNRKNITAEAFCKCMHLNQGALLSRLGRRFGFKAGGRGDFAVLDVGSKALLDPSSFFSKAKHSPFKGMELDARVSETWVRGRPFFVDGKFTEYAKGREIEKDSI
ncbi:MAG: amidohydrolase family protein [Candidatus Methanofastidiosa archaeon]|nr:amidohydrolase family protein [Candidatus Methanofastidiosa archaeon]